MSHLNSQVLIGHLTNVLLSAIPHTNSDKSNSRIISFVHSGHLPDHICNRCRHQLLKKVRLDGNIYVNCFTAFLLWLTLEGKVSTELINNRNFERICGLLITFVDNNDGFLLLLYNDEKKLSLHIFWQKEKWIN